MTSNQSSREYQYRLIQALIASGIECVTVITMTALIAAGVINGERVFLHLWFLPIYIYSIFCLGFVTGSAVIVAFFSKQFSILTVLAAVIPSTALTSVIAIAAFDGIKPWIAATITSGVTFLFILFFQLSQCDCVALCGEDEVEEGIPLVPNTDTHTEYETIK